MLFYAKSPVFYSVVFCEKKRYRATISYEGKTMAKFSTILFDLDGTITDPKNGITKSVAYALDYFHIPYPSLDSLCTFIGPPLRDSFSEYGVKESDLKLASEKYREYYIQENGIFDLTIYPGFMDMLKKLKQAEKKIFLATCKTRIYANDILEHFSLAPYFDFVSGSELDGTRITKGEVIAYALAETKTQASEQVIMVGDRKHDILGAKENSLQVASVLYGYGTREEFLAHHTDFIVETVKDLEQFLLQ